MPLLIALRSLGGSLLGFLAKLNPYQLALIALGLFALVQHFELASARKDATAYLKQRDAYKAQLDSISTRRNEQKAVTRDRIVTVIKTLKGANQRAKVIEAAPLPGNCKTPPEILSADL